MPKRGDVARESVKNTIIKAFQDTGDFICFQDKKIFVQAKDGPGGETLQFAISMTMPKTQVEVKLQSTNGAAWEVDTASATNISTELSPEDKQQVEMLKQKLQAMGFYKD